MQSLGIFFFFHVSFGSDTVLGKNEDISKIDCLLFEGAFVSPWRLYYTSSEQKQMCGVRVPDVT